MRDSVQVIKLNPQRIETWRYAGTILGLAPQAVLLEAHFNREDIQFHGMSFRKDDPFTEIYFSDRWYNLYEIHDREDDHLKGWYCNVSLPAELDLDRHEIRYVDLALDLLVFPDGRQLVLDENEFALIAIPSDTRQSARAALKDLKTFFKDLGGLGLTEYFKKQYG